MGKRLGHAVQPPLVVALLGELGSGKTCFAQGVAQGLGIKQPVTSPTFSLIQQYPGSYPLIHVDCYRLTGEEDAESIGLTEVFRSTAIVLVEWAEKIESLLPDRHLQIRMEMVDETTRLIYGEMFRKENLASGKKTTQSGRVKK